MNTYERLLKMHRSKVAELESEVALLREEKARLDDLERLMSKKFWPVFAIGFTYGKVYCLTTTASPGESDYICGHNLREAIDKLRYVAREYETKEKEQCGN